MVVVPVIVVKVPVIVVAVPVTVVVVPVIMVYPYPIAIGIHFFTCVYWEGKVLLFFLKISHVIHSLATVIYVWSHWSLS